MNNNETNQSILILNLMKNKCGLMTDFIFKYFVKSKSTNKYFFDLLVECYKDIQAYSELMLNFCWSQAAVILRLAIERICSFVTMAKHEELIDEYIKIFKQKGIYLNSSEEDQIKFCKSIGVNKNKINNYFDYGWIKPLKINYGRDQIVKIAGFEECLPHLKDMLNSFVHGSVSIFQFSGPNGTWEQLAKERDYLNRHIFILFQMLFIYMKKHFKDAYFDYTPVDDVYELTLKILPVSFVKKEKKEAY